MFFKKILFSLFFISLVLISGYYFYQRNKSKKEDSYPVNNKEEIQEGEFQEETEEEAALVEINGWLDCLLLNTIFYLLMECFFYKLFTAILKKMADAYGDIELDKIAGFQLTNHFADYMNKKKSIYKENIDKIISEKKAQFINDINECSPDEKATLINAAKIKLVHFYKIKYCLKNNRFFLDDDEFLYFVLNWAGFGMNPTIFFIFFFIIHIILGYDLYFLMKSFWQVGFSKTFENLNWLDLFSIEKVFRRNSIMKKIAFLVSFILTTGFTFIWAFNKYKTEKEGFLDSAEKTFKNALEKTNDNSRLTTEEENDCRSAASQAIDELQK